METRKKRLDFAGLAAKRPGLTTKSLVSKESRLLPPLVNTNELQDFYVRRYGQFIFQNLTFSSIFLFWGGWNR